MSGFLDGDLFGGEPTLNEAKKPQSDHAVKKPNLSNKPQKLCPRCGKPGSGPYSRWVKNSAGNVYTPFYYFAHRVDAKITWCYIAREKLKETEAP